MMREEPCTEATVSHPAVGLPGLLAARVRRWRQAKGLPLKQMALDLGVSISIISAWENGTRFPSVGHLEQLSNYMGVPVCRLFCQGEGECRRGNCRPLPGS